jgi:hypothetical protein
MVNIGREWTTLRQQPCGSNCIAQCTPAPLRLGGERARQISAESRVSTVVVEVLSTGAAPNARTSTVAVEVLHSLTEQVSDTGGQKPIVVVVAG